MPLTFDCENDGTFDFNTVKDFVTNAQDAGLTILGSAREILGAGSVFGITLLPETTNILMFILPPGAFLTLGYIIAIFNKVKK